MSPDTGSHSTPEKLEDVYEEETLEIDDMDPPQIFNIKLMQCEKVKKNSPPTKGKLAPLKGVDNLKYENIRKKFIKIKRPNHSQIIKMC